MTKKKKMNRLIALALTMMMFVCLLPAKAAWAFNPENYRAQITKISVGTPLTDTDTGKKYLPVTVYFTAEEDLGDSSVEFLEGYLKVKLANGQTAEGITGLGMTLIGMGALKPDAFPPFPNDNNKYSWSWSEGTGTGVLKYNIPLLDSDATQTVETSLATGQEEVNGIKPGDQIGFQIETVMNVPSDVLPEGGLFSDIFRFTVEDTSNYPKEITISEGGGSDSKTISIPEGLTLTYNGEEQTGVLPGSGYSLEGKIKATDAGLYVAYVTPDWGYSWVDGTGQMTKIVDWSIKKAELNVVALTKEEFTYNGKVQKPEIQSVTANGVTVPESEYTATIPEKKDAGSYTVQVTAKSGSKNYTGTASGDFTITKVNLDDAEVIFPEGKDENSIYREDEAKEIKLKDLVKGEDYTQTIESRKDDNDQEKWIITDKAKGSNTIGERVIQVKKDNTKAIAIPKGETLTYNGEEQTGVLPGSGYSLEGKIKATDAGLYVAYVTPDWGYSWVDGTGQMTKIVDWSIKKAELNVVALTKEEFTYNGKVQKPEIQSVKANGVAVPESEYTAKIPEEKNAGRYTVQVTAKTGSNNFTGTASGDFTIRQMDLDDAQVIYPEEMSETDIYTKEQAREIKLKDLVKGEDYTQSITSKKDDNDQYNWVVTYTAKGNNTTGKLVVQVRKDPAEKDPESVVKTPMATITKNPTANTLTYTGEEQKLVTEGQASGGTMSYALGKNDTVVPGRGWSETVPTATNSGTYYVWYKAVGDDSHRDSDAFCVTVSISKNNPKYTSEWVNGKWYNKDGTQTYKYRGSWKKKKNRTRFGTESGWYAKNCWQKIDGKWYFFDQDGNREENTWRKGWHLGADGSWDGKDKAEGWKLTDDGWTFIDADGNMLNSGWETIDEKWYYFHETGVAAQSEFVNGWWLSKDCSWTYPHRSRWKKRKGKWTYSDSSGWKAKNATYKIDSKKQSFDNDGNWIEE